MYPHHQRSSSSVQLSPSGRLESMRCVVLVPLKAAMKKVFQMTKLLFSSFTLKVCSFCDNDNRGDDMVAISKPIVPFSTQRTINLWFSISARFQLGIENLNLRLPTGIQRIASSHCMVTASVNSYACTGRSALIYIIISAYNQCIQLVLITQLRHNPRRFEKPSKGKENRPRTSSLVSGMILKLEMHLFRVR